jgi:DNA-directed RNA polymerase subunit F
MKAMVIQDKTGKKLITGHEAAEIFSCDPSYIRKLCLAGELTRVEESPRRVYYYLDQVQRLNKEKSRTRKERGGRPRKGPEAA